MYYTLLLSLVLLLAALLALRDRQKYVGYSATLEQLLKHARTIADNWRTKYDIQVGMINKLQLDNALLRASLKRKHLRVPKL